jgi:DNA-binding sugar fermentation-stimulating protein
MALKPSLVLSYLFCFVIKFDLARFFLEVKNVPLAKNSTAVFPWGKINATTKVVSSRAIKHVEDLRYAFVILML